MLLDKILISKECLFLPNNGICFDRHFNKIKINIDINVQEVVDANNKLYVIGYTDHKDINTEYKLLQYDVQTNTSNECQDLHQLLRVDGACQSHGFIYIHDSDKILRYDPATKTTTRTHVGQTIYGLFDYKGELMICQKDYREILKTIEANNRLKIKFGKKLINKA